MKFSDFNSRVMVNYFHLFSHCENLLIVSWQFSSSFSFQWLSRIIDYDRKKKKLVKKKKKKKSINTEKKKFEMKLNNKYYYKSLP